MVLANANACLWAIGNGLISTLLVIYLAADLGDGRSDQSHSRGAAVCWAVATGSAGAYGASCRARRRASFRMF